MAKALPVRELFKATPDEIKNQLNTDLTILFEDGVKLDLTFREITLLRFIIEVYKSIPDIPIKSGHCFTNFYTNGILTSKTINDGFSVILKDAIQHYVIGLGQPRTVIEPLLSSMYTIVNLIYNNLTYRSLEYVSYIGIVDLLKVQLKPKLLDSIKDVYIIKNKQPTHIVTEAINKTHEILNDILWNDAEVTNNPIALGYKSGTLNPNQVKQVLASRGFITELDNSIFRVPAAGSFTLGMFDLYEETIESRSGAKSLFLSNKAIKDSEYFARELQLVTMVVEKLVDGDCGTKRYMDWYVKPKSEESPGDLPRLLGKYYYNPKTKQDEEITKDHKHLIGQNIKIRSAICCQLPDPTAVCMKCFGTLGYSIPTHANVGHYCAASVTQQLTQSILSTKHLTKSASSAGIVMDDIAKDYFYTKGDFYFFKPEAMTKDTTYEIIINQWQFFGLKDVKNIKDIDNVNVQRLSLIRDIILRIITKDKVKDVPIQIKFNKAAGSFTHPFLHFLSSKEYHLDNNNNYVLNLDGWNPKHPIIYIPSLEFDFSTLCKNVKDIIRAIGTNKRFGLTINKPEQLIQTLFDLINSKLSVNLSIVDLVAYAFTIQDANKNDYRLGRNNPNQRVLNSRTILANRSLGAGYGWESMTKTITSPNTFYPSFNTAHPLDVLLKPNSVLLNK